MVRMGMMVMDVLLDFGWDGLGGLVGVGVRGWARGVALGRGALLTVWAYGHPDLVSVSL